MKAAYLFTLFYLLTRGSAFSQNELTDLLIGSWQSERKVFNTGVEKNFGSDAYFLRFDKDHFVTESAGHQSSEYLLEDSVLTFGNSSFRVLMLDESRLEIKKITSGALADFGAYTIYFRRQRKEGAQ